jgi:hypothetical protein
MNYNIYCDESCHLEHDNQDIMVLGAVWAPTDKIQTISKKILELKSEYFETIRREVKWTKISPSKKGFYKSILKYFFDENDLHFRVLIAKDKNQLRHEEFMQDHDTWYYKMYFNMLKIILDPQCSYNIYIDIKDTHSSHKIKELNSVLSNEKYDFSREIIKGMHVVRSHESTLMQLADILTGAISYYNRGLSTNVTKIELIKYIKERSGYSLDCSTLYKENKFNIFVWHPDSGVF